MVLSLEIGIRFIATPVTPWVLQEIEAWHVGDGYATGPARLWDEDDATSARSRPRPRTSASCVRPATA